MAKFQVNKTYQEINEKIKQGKAVVVTAEEMVGIVRKKGEVAAARQVDVVTTGTFSPMCSSGAFLNFGQAKPPIKASIVRLNNVPAYAGLAAVDIYIGATEPAADDPLNKVYPGEFKYGGGHVIQDLVAGKAVHLVVEAYGTDCYPNKRLAKNITLKEMVNAILCNPRNCYQNYNCAVNLSNRTIYTYMGPLKPRAANANYCTSGELSPLFNDPFYRTVGIGTRIFLGGAVGYVVFPGTQHHPERPRGDNGVPLVPAGTLMVVGDLKKMSPRYLVGVSILGYGCSLAVGLGVPIPVLDEEMAHYCGVSDAELFAPIVDYGSDYPAGMSRILGQVSYAELKSGKIKLDGQEVATVPLSSLVRAREIANLLKEWIEQGQFFVSEPVERLPLSQEKPPPHFTHES
ncbi:MAG: homocysteine biosynthesis protein [Deltaproteobacteria bacterium]|nr:homocysteine biosynthesis protein [Deltaproteobacteria bacterium]